MSNLGEIATWATALATLLVVAITCYQLRLSRLSLGVDLLLKLEDRFNTQEMRERRRKAAIGLQNRKITQELQEVLGFFETIGLLLHQNAINGELVWNSFGPWIICYSNLSKDYIKHRRDVDADKTYWQEFENLAKRMQKTDKKKRDSNIYPPAPNKELDEFLEAEVDLL